MGSPIKYEGTFTLTHDISLNKAYYLYSTDDSKRTRNRGLFQLL